MVTAKAVDIITKTLAGGAVALIAIALLVVSVDHYDSSPRRCSDYAIQKSHVVDACLHTTVCTVTPADIAAALINEHDYPQCFGHQETAPTADVSPRKNEVSQ